MGAGKYGVGFSGGGSGGGSTYNPLIVITKSEADALIDSNSLVAGQSYEITGVNTALYGGTNIILQATSTDAFSESGSGQFFNPNYKQNAAGYNIWSNLSTWNATVTSGTFLANETVTADNGATGTLFTTIEANEFVDNNTGDWTTASSITGDSSGATANIDTVNLISYIEGSNVFWGGYAWQNISGQIGSSIDVLNLDTDNWTKVPFTDDTLYKTVWNEIKYDYYNDLIIYRADHVNNIVNTSYGNDVYNNDNFSPYSCIAVFQWGNHYDSAYGVGLEQNLVDGAYCECVNFTGSIFAYNSFNSNSNMQGNLFDKSTFRIWGNKISEFSNLSANYLSTNINVSYNSLSSQSYIFGNKLSINSNINYNSLSDISYINGNTLNNSSFINYNSLSSQGNIYGNTLNNSNVVYNSLSSQSNINSNTCNSSSINDNSLSSQGGINGNTLNDSSNISNNSLSISSNISSNTCTSSNISNNSLSSQSNINGNTLNGALINNNTLNSASTIYSNSLLNQNSIINNTLNNISNLSTNTFNTGGTIERNNLSSTSYFTQNTISAPVQYNSLDSESYFHSCQIGGLLSSNTFSNNSYFESLDFISGSIANNSLNNGSYFISIVISDSTIEANTLNNQSYINAGNLSTGSAIHSNTLNNISGLESITFSSNSEISQNNLQNGSIWAFSNEISNKPIKFVNSLQGNFNGDISAAFFIYESYPRTMTADYTGNLLIYFVRANAFAFHPYTS